MITKKRILPILVAMLMVFAMMPMSAGTAYASSGDPAMSLGTDVLDQNVNTSTAQKVWYADKTWRVIGYDGKDGGAASKSGAVTLLAAGNLEQTPFDGSGDTSNVYANSTLKTKIDTIAGSFSVGEQGAIVKKTLVHGDYNGSDTDCIAGDADIENVLLWPLSTKEANDVDEGIRRLDEGTYRDWAIDYWWLRSPGGNGYSIAIVNGIGNVNLYGYNVDHPYGVRPAFDLNLESVLFTSAAVGGKSSGNEGADALKAQSDQTNSGDEWKVTLQSGHADFELSECTPTESGVEVKYTGATVGTEDKPEYISAVITDKPITEGGAAIKYYGRIAAASEADGAVTINTAEKLGSGDTLYVFNEQYNSDKKTDYASALQKVTFTKPKLTITAKDQTYEYNGQTQGEGDTVYEDPAQIAEKVTVEGLQAGDELTSIVVDGQGTDVGKYDLVPSNATINEKPASDKYAVTYVNGKLTIAQPAPVIKVSGTLLSKLTAKGKSSLVLTWNKVKGAEGYDIFFAKCGKNDKNALKKVKTIKGNKTLKWTKKSLKKQKAYKAFVRAYVKKNGKKTYVRTSPLVHAYTSGGTKNYTSPKSVTVNRTSVLLKAGKTYKIKAGVTKLQKGKKLMTDTHAPKLRYLSSSKKIATVSKSGKITAKAKGSCRIYVIAVNGAYKSVSVTVK